jgi:hypothetical protein
MIPVSDLKPELYYGSDYGSGSTTLIGRKQRNGNFNDNRFSRQKCCKKNINVCFNSAIKLKKLSS